MRSREFLEPSTRYVDSNVDSYVALSVNDSEIELKIADCNRNVKLAFTPSRGKYGRSRAKALRKVHTLQRYLDAVEAAVLEWDMDE